MMSKVVLEPSADGDIGLRINTVVTPAPARTTAGTELHLGSHDLIRLAEYARQHSFSVSSFMIADGYLVPLPHDEQLELSDEMIKILRDHGGNELEAAMQEEYDGLYVVGVTLISGSGTRAIVKRRGFVETSVVHEAENLLRSAWQELRLS